MTMILWCPCCGRKFDTTSLLCSQCATHTICSCGARFCNRHQADLIKQHAETCDGWKRITNR